VQAPQPKENEDKEPAIPQDKNVNANFSTSTFGNKQVLSEEKREVEMS